MKWKKLCKQGKVPRHIKELYDSCDGRKEQTQLLNRLFVKDPKTGTWDLKTENPSFQAWMKTSDKSYGKEAAVTYPKAIMLHHFFHGNEGAFSATLDAGDVVEVTKGGKSMYSFETMETGREKQKDHQMELRRGQHKISAKEHKAIGDGVFDRCKICT